MMGLFIFIYGTMVFGVVSLAIGLIAWGIVNERRDRTRLQQGREVFGEPAASMETTRAHGAMSARAGRERVRRRGWTP
jgi:hypothetical protein